jgi:sugar phosphate permease
MRASMYGKAFTFMLTFFGYSTLHAMRTSWSYSKKLMQNETGITNEDLGFVDMSFLLCYSLGLAFIGPLGDRFNRRYFLALGYYTCGLAYLVFPTVHHFFGVTNIWVLIIFMSINGLGESVGMPGSMGVLSNWFTGKNKGVVVGTWAGCCNYGNIFGLISSTIISQYMGLKWQYIFFFNGMLTLGIATVIMMFLEEKPKDDFVDIEKLLNDVNKTTINGNDSSAESQQNLLKVNFFTSFKIPRVIPYVISYSCLKASIYGLLFWLPKYVSEKGMSGYSGYIPAMMDCGTFLGGVLVGFLGDRFGKRSLFLSPLMVLSCLMMLIAKFLLSDVPLPYFFIIFFMGLGLGGPYNIIGKEVTNFRDSNFDRPWLSGLPEGQPQGHLDCDSCDRRLRGVIRCSHPANARRDEP